ncbi:MAG: hypothetical protein L0323_23425, partial [Planctomycetes bacterium]|nr:hypothetical protein [Planctomycetota bacterium]
PAPLGEVAAVQPLGDFDPSTFLFVDEPGDGAIWARGGSYKASFSAEGFTYIPFLGATAPRNYPVRLTPEFVGVGGANLVGDKQPLPRRVGETRVVYDHGAFEEVYELRPDGVEQLFVLRSPAGEGDLVVRLRVETDLGFAGVEEGAHLFAAPGLGGAKYGKAFLVDGEGTVRPAAVVHGGGALEVRVPSSTVAAASHPLTVDPVISTFGVDPSVGYDDFNPDVCFSLSAGKYVFTYEDIFSNPDHDVWTRTRSDGGALGPYVAQDITIADWRDPKNADNNAADRVLVVAAVPGSLGQRDIRGRTFDPATEANASAQFDIEANILWEDSSPDVGGDPYPVSPTFFCVVWERTSGTLDHDILSRTVHPTTLALGTVVDLDLPNLLLNRFPAISKGNDLQSGNWYVAYRRDGFFDFDNIWGGRLAWDGTLIGSPFILGNGVGLGDPDVARGDGEALFVWHQDASGGHDVYGCRVVGGGAVGNAVNLSFNEPGGDYPEDQRNPTVGADGCRFVYAYAESVAGSTTNYDIRLAAVRGAGTSFVWDEGHVFVSNGGTPALEDHPAITSRWTAGGSGPEYALGFDDDNNGGSAGYDVQGILYEAHSGALLQATVPTSCGAPAPAIGASGTSALNGTLSVQTPPAQGGLPLLLVGPPGSTPLCAGTGPCLVGMPPGSALLLPGASLAGPIPCDPALAGAVIAFQGAEFGFGLSGGCVVSGIGVLLSDTLLVTLTY